MTFVSALRTEAAGRGASAVAARRRRRGDVAAGGARDCRRRGDAARLVERRRGGASGAARRAVRPTCSSSACRARSGAFPPSRVTHPPALRLERTIRDLYGLEPEGAPDTRRWLDHGRWGVRHRSARARRQPPPATPTRSCTADGPPLHQIPVGPVHAGIIEPGHFRFTCNGETVVRLEERLGYVHKGIDGLMLGAPLDKAAKLAGRVSGDSTVAYAIAFARAVEAALGLEPPPRAVYLRALMARARAPRQPLRRHRRHLQRRLLLAHPRPLRHPARARAARRRRLLRPPPDDGPRGAGRHRRRPGAGGRAGAADAHPHHPPPLPRAGRALRQHRLAAEPHHHHRRPDARAGAPIRRRRLHRPRLGARLRRAQAAGLRALRRLALRYAGAAGGRRRRPRVGAHRRGRASRWR